MDELFLGLSLGWAAGISPGPLTALIVTTTLRHGLSGGARIAVAPLITDFPVVAVTVTTVSALPDGAVRGLGLAGGAYLVWLGIQEVRAARAGLREQDTAGTRSVDLRRGAITNILNPQMWLFWVTVGAPIVAGASDVSAAGLFLGSFYLLLIGTKLTLAWLVSVSRRRIMDSVWARRLGVLGGLALVAVGVAVSVRAW